jgi:hypothetical protein
MAKTLYEFKNIVFFVFSIFFSQPYTQKKDIQWFHPGCHNHVSSRELT